MLRLAVTVRMQLQYSTNCTAVLFVITYLDNCSYGSAAAPAVRLQPSETQVTCSSLAAVLQCCSNLSQLYIILDNSSRMISDDSPLTRGQGFPHHCHIFSIGQSSTTSVLPVGRCAVSAGCCIMSSVF